MDATVLVGLAVSRRAGAGADAMHLQGIAVAVGLVGLTILLVILAVLEWDESGKKLFGLAIGLLPLTAFFVWGATGSVRHLRREREANRTRDSYHPGLETTDSNPRAVNHQPADDPAAQFLASLGRWVELGMFILTGVASLVLAVVLALGEPDRPTPFIVVLAASVLTFLAIAARRFRHRRGRSS